MIALILWSLLPQIYGQTPEMVSVGGTEYHVSSMSPYSGGLSWHLAYQYCRTLRMELLTLHTTEQATELQQYLTHAGAGGLDYWSSGNRLGGSNRWQWMTTGQPYNTSFTYWTTEDKQHTRRQRRAALTDGQQCMVTRDALGWRAETCGVSHHFICQLSRCYFTTTTTAARSADTAAGNGSDTATNGDTDNTTVNVVGQRGNTSDKSNAEDNHTIHQQTFNKKSTDTSTLNTPAAQQINNKRIFFPTESIVISRDEARQTMKPSITKLPPIEGALLVSINNTTDIKLNATGSKQQENGIKAVKENQEFKTISRITEASDFTEEMETTDENAETTHLPTIKSSPNTATDDLTLHPEEFLDHVVLDELSHFNEINNGSVPPLHRVLLPPPRDHQRTLRDNNLILKTDFKSSGTHSNSSGLKLNLEDKPTVHNGDIPDGTNTTNYNSNSSESLLFKSEFSRKEAYSWALLPDQL